MFELRCTKVRDFVVLVKLFAYFCIKYLHNEDYMYGVRHRPADADGLCTE